MKGARYLLLGIIVIVLSLSTIGSLGSTIVDNKPAEIFMRNPASRGAVLEVTTDKTGYSLDETVTIFLTNVGDEILSAGGPIVTIYDEYNEIVYQDACYCWWELEPGEYITWTWDQTNQQGNQVPIGKYVVEGFLSGGGENYVDTATFFIIDYEPPGAPYGPTEGVVGVGYTFCIDLPDNTDCEPYYVKWDWGDGTMNEWLGPYAAGETVCAGHSWNEPGDYEIRVKIKDGCGNEYWSDPLTIHIVENGAPSTPVITGPTTGKPGVEYEYTFVSTDPDGDELYYHIDWYSTGDIIIVGPYESGEAATLRRTFPKKGTYIIRAKAIDIHGAESNWGTLEVEMPVDQQSSSQSSSSQQSQNSQNNQQSSSPLFFQILERILQNIR